MAENIFTSCYFLRSLSLFRVNVLPNALQRNISLNRDSVNLTSGLVREKGSVNAVKRWVCIALQISVGFGLSQGLSDSVSEQEKRKLSEQGIFISLQGISVSERERERQENFFVLFLPLFALLSLIRRVSAWHINIHDIWSRSRYRRTAPTPGRLIIWRPGQ